MTLDSPQKDDGAQTSSKVRELVAQCLELMLTDGEGAIESICREHPELAPLVRQRLDFLRQAGLLDDPPQAHDFPQRLGEFTLKQRLGGGGMGVVYVAEQQSLGRLVAVKVVRPDLLHFAGARERFRREGEAIARLQHPNVVPIFSVGEDQGIPFFAMQLVDGCTLAQALEPLLRLRPEKLSGRDVWQELLRLGGKKASAGEEPPALFRASWVEFCLRCVLEVAAALQHAHERGVLHRDLKPSNILITPSGRVLLFDFGLASSEGTSKLTRTGALLGSVPYMSPEQCRGGAVDERSDVYSLGVTLYELLTLRSPFAAETTAGTQRRILEGRPVSIRLLNPNVAWDAETVCLTAIDLDRERRYATAAAFVRDLENCLARRPITARRPGPVLRFRRFAQRHPAWTVGMALGLLMFVGSIAFAIWQKATNIEISRAYQQSQLDRAEAVRQKEIADREQARATEREQQARENLRTARQAVQQMLAHVGEVVLMNVPQMEQIRRRLLEDSVQFYRILVEESGMDPEVRFEMAQSMHRLGRIQLELGTPEKANEMLSQTYRVLQELGGVVDVRRLAPQLALVESDLAGSEWMLGRVDEAERSYRRALEHYRELAEGRPSAPVLRYRQAEIEINLGAIAGESELLEEAADHLRRARDLADDLCREAPESLEYREQRVAASVNLGSTLARMDEGEEAGEMYLAAKEELERLVALVPGDVSRRTTLATVCGALGMLRSKHDAQEAIRQFEQAVEINEKLAADFPTQAEFPVEAARWSIRLGNQWRSSGDRDKAREVLRRASDLLDGVEARAPLSVDGRMRRGELDFARGELLASEGKVDEALAALRRAEERFAALAQSSPNSADYETGLRGTRQKIDALLASRPVDGK